MRLQRIVIMVALFGTSLLLLFPFSGVDTFPPVHYSVFNIRVPSGNPWLSVSCASGISLFGGFLHWRLRRDRR